MSKKKMTKAQKHKARQQSVAAWIGNKKMSQQEKADLETKLANELTATKKETTVKKPVNKKTSKKKASTVKTTSKRKSKLDKVAAGITGLADTAGVDATLGGLTTGKTVDRKPISVIHQPCEGKGCKNCENGKLVARTFTELMALPPGRSAPPEDEWVQRWSGKKGTLRSQGLKTTMEWKDGKVEEIEPHLLVLPKKRKAIEKRIGFRIPFRLLKRLNKLHVMKGVEPKKVVAGTTTKEVRKRISKSGVGVAKINATKKGS